MKKSYMGLAFAVLLAVPVASANAALNAYLKITGSHTKSFAPENPSGFFQALVTNENLLAQAAPAEVSAVASPRDAATGQATGRRKYEPIRFVKTWDKATPMLARAWSSQEALPRITMVIYKDLGNGKVEIVGEATFLDCVLKEYDKASPVLATKPVKGKVSAGGPAPGQEQPMESVSFTYAKIEWTYKDKGKVMSDVVFKYDLKENKKV